MIFFSLCSTFSTKHTVHQ
ncbi:hypothetical protein ACS0PU_003480 [Formica fusca]